MVQTEKSHGNHAVFSSWGEAELFQHPSVGLCPKLSSFKLQLHHLCLAWGTQTGGFGVGTHKMP